MRKPSPWKLVAALALVAVVAVAMPAIGKSKMDAAPAKERLFDHARHAQTVKVECARCHEVKDGGGWVKTGKKEHARCFSCHKFSANCGTLKRKEGRVCVSCHVTMKAACLPAAYHKPAAGKNDFSATYSHRLHIRPRASSGRQCETCHGDFGRIAPKTGGLGGGHALCSGCHAYGVSPRIKESCDGCHVDLSGSKAAVLAPRAANVYAVKRKFDHQAHAMVGRVGTAGRECLTCHENIRDAKEDDLIPMPTMQGCQQACHDGKKAFDALGTTCTRCHTAGGR